MKKTNPLVSDDSVNAILQIASAFELSKILLTACELDIFSILGNDEKTAKEIAIEAGSDEKSTAKLLNALVSMNLLNKTMLKYHNTKGTRKFLVKNRPEYIGNMMFYTHIWEKWGELTDAVKQGKAVSYKDISEKDDEWIESYVESNHWRAVLQAPDIVKQINFQDINSILDLGCGSGLYPMEFKKAKPSMQVTAMDLPNVIKHTKSHLKRDGFIDSINLIEGDIFKDDFGSGYDAIFISSVLSYYSIWENIDLIHKIFNSLNHGGCVIVQESIIEDSRTNPEMATVLSLNMLVNTQSGDIFTDSDIWMILREGWLTNIKRIDTQFQTSLFFGYR